MPVYLYWGDEEYNIETSIKGLKSKILDPAWAMLNYKSFCNPDINTLIDSLQVMPMFMGNLLIEIESNYLFMRGGKKAASVSEAQLKKLVNIIETLNDNIYVLFVCKIAKDSGKKIDSASKIVKTISKVGKIEEFPAFKSYQEKNILAWLKQMALKKKIKITDNAGLLMVHNIGTELRRLDSELEKLKLLVYPSDIVEVKHVKEISADHENIFLLADLLLKQDKLNSIIELHKLYENNHPVKIISTLQTIVRKWLKLKLESKNKSIFEVSKLLNIHKFVVEKDLNKLKDISVNQLVDLKQKLTDCEYKIKSGDIEPEISLELLVAS